MRYLILVGLLVGCGGAESETDPEPDLVPVVDGAPAPQTFDTDSNAGGFYARWRPLGGEVPLNEDYTAEVWLFEDGAGERPLEDADVVIDCRMPAHRHGMLQDVELVHQGGGRYLAEGMMCHMLGHWELYVDVTRGRITERAQWDIYVE